MPVEIVTKEQEDLYKAMAEDHEEAEYGSKATQLNQNFHLDRKRMLGKIDPYSEEGKKLLSSDERITLQRIWCMATETVPKKRASSFKDV